MRAGERSSALLACHAIVISVEAAVLRVDPRAHLKLVIDVVWTRALSLASARPARARSRGAARHGCHCSQGDRGARDCSARRSSRQSRRAGPAALRRSGIAYPPGRCRVSREANVPTSVERCGCDESGTVSFGRSRLVARQCPGEVLASVEHAPRYGTPRAPPRGGRAGACQRHLLGPGDQRRRPAEPPDSMRSRLATLVQWSQRRDTVLRSDPRSSGVRVVDPVALVPVALVARASSHHHPDPTTNTDSAAALDSGVQLRSRGRGFATGSWCTRSCARRHGRTGSGWRW